MDNNRHFMILFVTLKETYFLFLTKNLHFSIPGFIL